MAVQANELRKGSLVKTPNETQNPFRVDYFDETKVYQSNGSYKTNFGMVPYHPLTWDIKDIQPILLTPEILEKCGFEKADTSNEYWTHWGLKNGWHISESHHNQPEAGVETGICYWGENYTPVKHLHQLQNLFFSLCGNELPVNL